MPAREWRWRGKLGLAEGGSTEASFHVMTRHHRAGLTNEPPARTLPEWCRPGVLRADPYLHLRRNRDRELGSGKPESRSRGGVLPVHGTAGRGEKPYATLMSTLCLLFHSGLHNAIHDMSASVMEVLLVIWRCHLVFLASFLWLRTMTT